MKRPTYRVALSYDCWKCSERHLAHDYISADNALNAERRGHELALEGDRPHYDYRFEGVSLQRGNPEAWLEQRHEVKRVIEKKGGVYVQA